MARRYQPKLLPDGSPNPKFYARKTPGYTKERRAEYDKSRAADRSGAYKSRFDAFDFIAIDGEGGEHGGKHVYQLLMDSGGSNTWAGEGLTTDTCLSYLYRLAKQSPKSILTIFAGSYDANMWLCDVPRETLQAIKDADGKYYVSHGEWQIRYIARKYFAFKRIADGVKAKAVVVWDVHGFFQGSFIAAVKAWLPDWDKSKLDLIIKGKEIRSHFTESDRDFTKRYCLAEVEALREIMIRFRKGLQDMGLKLSRWDGAGAVAMAMYKVNAVKEHYQDLPPAVEIAAQHAYFGGRIEIGKFGNYDGDIFHYDINSAYPSAQCTLPSLRGEWKHFKPGRGGVEKFTDDWRHRIESKQCQTLTLFLVKWSNIVNTRFCPFPYRSATQRKVLFPSAGYNWVWLPEVEAALKWQAEKYDYWNFEICEVWSLKPESEVKPFAWIVDYYETRKRIVAESKKTGIPNGQEKIIKLGLNSLYGKTAQKVGYNATTGAKPPYHNLAYAGYITSATRAKLWSAAMQEHDSIIALATDGVYSTKPLDLFCPSDKILGAWEAQRHDGMTLVQAGVYFIRDGEALKSFSRGFDKMRKQSEMVDTLNKILSAWNEYAGEIFLPCTRFITLKTALINDDWFTRWRTWYAMIQDDGTPGRRLQIVPHGTKREAVGSGNASKKFISTNPVENLTPDVLSEPHPLPWDEDANETNIDIEHSEGEY